MISTQDATEQRVVEDDHEEPLSGPSMLLEGRKLLQRHLEAAVASTSGLFLLHVLIDPLLKADMAAFIDKAAMNSG